MSPCFMLTLGGRAKGLLASEDFEIRTGDRGETFYNWSGDEEINIQARISTWQKGNETLSRISLTCEGECTIECVRYPIHEKSDMTRYDQLLISSPWGDLLEQPAQTIRQYWNGRDSGVWTYKYIRCNPNEVIYQYPSIMAMQYIVIFNQACSTYLASYSTRDDSMTFHARATGTYAIELSVGHYPYLSNGTWTSPLCGTAELEGGWHPAADLYASHMNFRFNDPDVPRWMTDPGQGFHGWVSTPMKYEGKQPLHRYSDLPRVYETVRETGLDILHVFGWANDGHDTDYPDSRIDPELGTAEDLRAAAAEIKRMGGRLILYLNGRLIDPESDFGQRDAGRSLCRDENGEPYTETYKTSSVYHVVCPTSEDYASYMADKVKGLIADYGVHGTQVDQISCNYGCFCHNKAHSHHTPADNFLRGVDFELKAIRTAHKESDPGFFIWCEGCHERFGQYYDVEQGHGEAYTWQIGRSLPEQFKYTYKRRIVTGLGLDLQQLCYSYIQGKPFDVPLRMLPDERYTRLLTELAAMRRKYPEFFINGWFMDDSELITEKSIKACAILSEKKDALLVSMWVNGARDDLHSGGLRMPSGYRRYQAVYPEDCRIIEDGQWLTAVFRGPVASIILR